MYRRKIPGPRYKRKSGIYLIRCKASGDTYVGKSKNLHQRYCQHSHDLKQGAHKNSKLQELYNTHGRKEFIMELLELVDGDLEPQEIFWIEEINPTLNLDSPKLSWKDVLDIRNSEEPLEDLAAKHSISVHYLHQVRRGYRWEK